MRFEYQYIVDKLIEEKVLETSKQIYEFYDQFNECLYNRTIDLIIIKGKIRGFFMWYEMPHKEKMRIFIDKMYVDKEYESFSNMRKLFEILSNRYKNLSLIYWLSNKKQKYIYREVSNG